MLFRLRPFLLAGPATSSFSPSDLAVLDAWYAAGDWDVTYGPIGQWNDSSGNGNHLTQATAANQPIGLPYDGDPYLWFPGVNQNWATAADKAMAGDFDDLHDIIKITLAADDWDGGGAGQSLYSKWLAAPQLSFNVLLNGNGGVTYQVSPDGTTEYSAIAANTDGGAAIAHGFTDEDKKHILVFASRGVGRVNFYTASDDTETLGSELLTDAQANMTGGWSFSEPGTTTLSGGEMVWSSTTSGATANPDVNILTPEKLYKVSIVVSEYTTGGLFATSLGHRGTYIAAAGTYTFILAASEQTVQFSAFGTTTLKISSMTVKEMTNWTPFGVEQTVASSSPYDSTSSFELGAKGNGVSDKFAGRIYEVKHYNRARDWYEDAPIMEFSPAASDDLVSSVGDWTISNATAATPACVVGKAHVMFDGANDDLASGSFDRTEPTTGYIKVRTITYSNSEFFMSSLVTAPVTWMGARWLSGNLWNGYGAGGTTTTPIAFTPGGDENLCVSWTGDSNSLIQDGSAGSPSTGTLTGSTGGNNPTGFRLGSLNGSGDYTNAFIDEAFFSGEADNAATIKDALEYLEAL